MKKVRKGLVGIYLLKDIISGGLFVGGAPSLTNCLEHHFDNLHSGKHTNKKMQLLWDLSGPTAFEFSLLEIVQNKAQLKERAEYWQKNLKADLAEEINLTQDYSGMLSVGSDIKSEIRALDLGSFDKTIQELANFYIVNQNDE